MPPPNPSCIRSGPLNTFKLQGVKRRAADRHDQILYYIYNLFINLLYFIINYLLLFIIYYLLFIIIIINNK